MYLAPDGTLTNRSVVGHLAVGVPGAVAGLLAALERHGTMTRAQVMAPAIRYAREGIVIDSGLARSIEGTAERIAQFEGGALFVPEGEPLPLNGRLVQPDLARTLETIAERGTDGFYAGWVADSLVAEMERGGGIVTREDLAAYTPRWRTPIRSSYRGFTLLAMPPSSSGGVTMTESLNILETWDALPAHGSTGWYHALGSAYQRAFIDRNAKIGDPEFVDVPIDELTSKTYAEALRATIRDDAATPTAQVDSAMRELAEPVHTTHYSVVDAMGNAVATTTTLNGSWGSGVWVRGAGFFLNNEMDDFAAQPGTPNMFGLVQGEQNAIQPGKRMLSAMSPTVVLDSAERVLMVVGAAGGPTIITGTSQVILNVLDQRMSLADAMRAPRTHHQALPDQLVVERDGLAPAVRDSLTARGWTIAERAALVNVNAILRVPGGWEGVSEPRRWGAARGY
jgi:gamma-glutamyltranspeptidase/glutathione hydrolase